MIFITSNMNMRMHLQFLNFTGHKETVYSVSFSHDSTRFASGLIYMIDVFLT